MTNATSASLVIVLAAAAPSVAADRLSERTLSVAIEVDRDGARVLAYTLKPRPFERATLDPSATRGGTEIEVDLLGPGGARIARLVDAGPICLEHGPDAPPHVAGDTIRVHRDSFVVEVPEIKGYDRLEIAHVARSGSAASRRVLGAASLSRDRFDPAGGPLTAADLAIGGDLPPSRDHSDLTTGGVHWPEEFDDPEVYALEGNEAEVGKRINVVIVPDGYTYAQKQLMQAHAAGLINFFRSKTPYVEHDPFLNYVLVYAYSAESGTDQCDCSIVKDTAMSTGFPNDGFPCEDSGNRCLYYGTGCDFDSSANIAAAELRAPAVDTTVVMVNTARDGGCGGARAVYAAGVPFVASETAGHELGHSLADLADEYGGTGCGTFAGELNTSRNGITGAWPEWISDIGSPRVGGEYYNECIYRPESNCEMRALGLEFCHVCNQRWGLTFFGHPRVSPTAPIESMSPASPAAVDLVFPFEFSVATRLASGGSGATDSITWKRQGPGDPAPVVVATGTGTYQSVFSAPGSYTLTCDVIADTNFIKPQKYGANRDVATWSVQASAFPVPGEVSPAGSPEPLSFATRDDLTWQIKSASGSSAFNVYRGTVADLAAGSYGSCLRTHVSANADADPDTPPPGVAWIYLVTGVTSSGEGTMGSSSAGAVRVNAAPCGGAAVRVSGSLRSAAPRTASSRRGAPGDP